MHTKKEFMRLSADFKECRDVLVALGDENRLHILYQMMITADPMGMRVGDIVRLSSLSRPAVSHHMKILKDGKHNPFIFRRGELFFFLGFGICSWSSCLLGT